MTCILWPVTLWHVVLGNLVRALTTELYFCHNLSIYRTFWLSSLISFEFDLEWSCSHRYYRDHRVYRIRFSGCFHVVFRVNSIYAEGLGWSHSDFLVLVSVSVSPCKGQVYRLVVFVSIPVVSLNPDSYGSFSPSGFPALPNICC